MTGLFALWVPVALSAVAVFILSSVLHSIPGWHKNDYLKIEEEDRFMDAVRPFGIPPGDYLLPRPSSALESGSMEFVQKMKKGPVMILTVRRNSLPAMWKNLVQWLLFSCVVSVFAAYVAGRALPAGSHYLHVFRFTGVTSFVGYSLALWQMSIWYWRSWGTTLRATVDGLIYAIATAGVFAWLWPK